MHFAKCVKIVEINLYGQFKKDITLAAQNKKVNRMFENEIKMPATIEKGGLAGFATKKIIACSKSTEKSNSRANYN